MSIITTLGLITISAGYVMFVAGGVNNAFGKEETDEKVFSTSFAIGAIGLIMSIVGLFL